MRNQACVKGLRIFDAVEDPYVNLEDIDFS